VHAQAFDDTGRLAYGMEFTTRGSLIYGGLLDPVTGRFDTAPVIEADSRGPLAVDPSGRFLYLTEHLIDIDPATGSFVGSFRPVPYVDTRTLTFVDLAAPR
jgi:hypothetical protein